MLFRGGLFGIAMLQAIGAKPTVFCFYYLCSISDDALTKRIHLTIMVWHILEMHQT